MPAGSTGNPTSPIPAPPIPAQPIPAQPKTPIVLSDAELRQRVAADLPSLGSMSVGQTNAGALVNGVHMKNGKYWKLVDPGNTWGTQETIDYLARAVEQVHRKYPNSHKMHIGHISSKHGGALSPHRSHQSGRDVDLSYYYLDPKDRWYRRANAKTLDRKRSWALVRALLSETDVQLILINTSVQKLLKEHAQQAGEDPAWLDDVFQYLARGKTRPRHHAPIIRHVTGHDTHLHVRFFNPRAQELGRRAMSLLAKHGAIRAAGGFKRYRARKGDLLGRLAKRFHTSVKAIQAANGLRSTRIKAGKTYLIPTKGKLRKPAKLQLPPRRRPPREPRPNP